MTHWAQIFTCLLFDAYAWMHQERILVFDNYQRCSVTLPPSFIIFLFLSSFSNADIWRSAVVALHKVNQAWDHSAEHTSDVYFVADAPFLLRNISLEFQLISVLQSWWILFGPLAFEKDSARVRLQVTIFKIVNLLHLSILSETMTICIYWK